LQHVSISIYHQAASVGRAWINLVERVLEQGVAMGEEGLELLGETVAFPAAGKPDEVLSRFGDAQMMAEMQKVFFSDASNSLGHSYAKLICGPDGRHDLQDVIELLRCEPLTKRAAITFSNRGGMKVPCINAVQFLVRNQAVQVMYFARGQDVFKKFYADALCLGTMAETVATGLGLSAGTVRGFIGSSHIYHRDTAAIRDLLCQSRQSLPSHSEERVLG
jgi:thymidylate synthase